MTAPRPQPSRLPLPRFIHWGRVDFTRRWGLALLVLALSMAATIIGFSSTRLILEQQALIKFDHRVEDVQGLIRTRLEFYLDALYGAKGFYAASHVVEPGEFTAYFNAIDLRGRHPGLLAVNFVERINNEPVLQRACDHGVIAITGRLRDQGHSSRFLLALPIYRTGAPVSTIEERRAALLGVVVGLFDAEEFFQDLFHQTSLLRDGLDVEIFDQEVIPFYIEQGMVNPPEGHLLFHLNPARVETAREHKTSRYHALVAFPVADGAWSLHFVASPGFGLDATQRVLSLLILAGGSMLSLLLFGMVYVLATSRSRATRLAGQMTSELRKQQELLLIHERAIAATDDGILITDPNQPDNPIVYCNQGFERMTGYAGQEALGRNCRFLQGDDRQQEGVMAVREAIQARRACRTLLRNYKKDGTLFWNELSIAPVFDEQGRLINFVGIAHDATAHKRLEEEISQKANQLGQTNVELIRRERITQSLLEDLQTSKRRLEQQRQSLEEAHTKLQHSHDELRDTQLQLIQVEKLESVGRLAAGVAHEVKNPLAVILMGVTYLSRQMANGDPNIPMVLNEMDVAVRKADTVIHGLLDFSTPSELHLSAEDLHAVIDQALLLVKHEFQRAHVMVVQDVASLPLVNMDANKIQQVFINLFMNAAHAMPTGGTLTIRAAAKPKAAVIEALGVKETGRLAKAESVIVAEIEDTGIGIPEEKLDKIFDPFFTTKPTGKGTGLGLTVAKKIIELHGGLIDIRNRPTGGVRATVVLP